MFAEDDESVGLVQLVTELPLPPHDIRFLIDILREVASVLATFAESAVWSFVNRSSAFARMRVRACGYTSKIS